MLTFMFFVGPPWRPQTSNGSAPSINGKLCPMKRAPKAQREWARPLSNWPPKLRRTVRLQRTRLPKPLSSWPRIVPVSFTGQSLPLMGGALLFEVCGRHDIQSAHWRPYEKHKRSEEHTSELQSQSNLVC